MKRKYEECKNEYSEKLKSCDEEIVKRLMNIKEMNIEIENIKKEMKSYNEIKNISDIIKSLKPKEFLLLPKNGFENLYEISKESDNDNITEFKYQIINLLSENNIQTKKILSVKHRAITELLCVGDSKDGNYKFKINIESPFEIIEINGNGKENYIISEYYECEFDELVVEDEDVLNQDTDGDVEGVYHFGDYHNKDCIVIVKDCDIDNLYKKKCLEGVNNKI